MWVDRRGSEVLPEPECRRLMALSAARGAVGHLAVSRVGAPLLHPVNFAFQDTSVLIRLGEGTMLDEAAGQLVSFEVDDVDMGAHTAWSVVGRGLASVLWPGEVEPVTSRLPAPVVPEPGEHLLAIRLDVMTGRRFPLTVPPAAGAA